MMPTERHEKAPLNLACTLLPPVLNMKSDIRTCNNGGYTST